MPISIGSKELEDDSVEVGEIHREFSGHHCLFLSFKILAQPNLSIFLL